MAYDGTLKFDTSLDASGFQKGANSLGNIVKGLGIFKILSKGVELVGQSVTAAFSRIDTMEKFDRVMTVMTGSARLTRDALKETTETVTGTAYGLDVAALAVQNFVSRGMDINKSTHSIAMWGDAVAFYGDGSSATFSGVTTALSKMQTKGTITMEHMEAILTAGIPAINIYAEAMGISTEDVANSMKKGEITADQFISAMDNAFESGTTKFPSIAGAAKEAGASWAGTWDNMKAAIARGTVSIIDSVDKTQKSLGRPTMREAIANFGKSFEKILKGIADIIPFVIKNFNKLVTAVISGFIAIKGYKIGDAVSKAFKTFTGSAGDAGAALALLREGYTATQIASTGLTTAQAMQATMTGILSGQMTIGTGITLVFKTAVQSLNAAFTANPIGFIITGVSLLISGISALTAVFGDNTEAVDEGWQKINDLKKAQEELRESSEQLRSDYEKNVTELNVQAGAAEKLTQKLEGLLKEDGKVISVRKQTKAIVDELNKSVEGLNLKYDEENHQLNMSAPAIRKKIAAQKEMLAVELAGERYTEVLEKQIEAEYNLKETSEALAEAKTAATEAEEKYAESLLQSEMGNAALGLEMDRARDRVAELTEMEKQYTVQKDENAAAVEAANKRLEDSSDALEAKINENNQSMGDSEKGLSDITEEESERRRTVLESYTEAATNMFDRIKTESETSVAEMTANLEHNQKTVESWSNNLVELGKRGLDEGLLQQLRDAGPESAATVSALVKASDKELSKLSTVFANGGDVAAKALARELGLPDVVNAGSDMVDDISSGIKSNKSLTDATVQLISDAKKELESGADSLVKGTISRLDNLPSKAANVINMMFEAMYGRMDVLAPGLYSRADKIADTIIGRLNTAFDIHSPSRVLSRIFTNVMLGAEKGLNDGESSLLGKLDGITDKVLTKFRSIPQGMATALNQKLRLAVESNHNATVSAIPAVAAASYGNTGSVTYVINSTQHITTPKPITPAEASREQEASLRRLKWQLG